jgi:hypothetical protein
MQRTPTPYDWGPEARHRTRRSRIVVALVLALAASLLGTAVLGAELVSMSRTPPVMPQPAVLVPIRVSGIIDATNLTSSWGGFVYVGVRLDRYVNQSGIIIAEYGPESGVHFYGVMGVPNLQYDMSINLEEAQGFGVMVGVNSGDSGNQFYSVLRGPVWPYSPFVFSFKLWRTADPSGASLGLWHIWSSWQQVGA